MELDGVCVPLLLDTGAALSLLNWATVKRFLPHITLQTPSAVLHGYGNSKIDLVSSLSCSVHYGNKSLATFTFQVARHGPNLMGLDLITSLGFAFMDSCGATILQVSSPWEQRWPALFSGLGCISAFTHQPLLHTDIHQVIQPLRRIPLALRDDVTAELTKLLELGIIEPVNASPWISNLVMVVAYVHVWPFIHITNGPPSTYSPARKVWFWAQASAHSTDGTRGFTSTISLYSSHRDERM